MVTIIISALMRQAEFSPMVNSRVNWTNTSYTETELKRNKMFSSKLITDRHVLEV